MAGIAFPSWAYNSAGQAAQIVTTQAAFNALAAPGTWALTPYTTTLGTAPIDTTATLTATDIRLQQSLVEQRVMNQLLYTLVSGQVAPDDPVSLRADVVANDALLTS